MTDPLLDDEKQRKHQKEQTEQHEHFLLQQSLFQLQTLTIPQKQLSFILSQDALFESCQLVGQQLGLIFQWSSTEEKDKPLTIEEKIHRLCLQSQVYYRKIRLVDNWWITLDFPFVGFYGENQQPVALISRFTKGYQLIDSVSKQALKLDQTTANQISSEGYIFYRALPEHKLSIAHLWTFSFWHRKKEWLVFLFLVLCSLSLNICIPIITNFIFDDIIPNRNLLSLFQISTGALALIFTALIFNFNRESLILRLMGLVDQDLELAIWQRMMSLPVNFFRKYSLYDLFTFTSAISTIRQLITSQVIMVFMNAGFSFIFIILMFYYGPTLAFAGLAILAFEFIVILLFLPFIIRYGRQLIDRQIESSNKTFEIIQAISKIRLAAAEIRFFHRWEQTFSQMKRLEIKNLLLKMKMAVFNIFWSNISFSILYLFVIYLLSAQSTSFVFANQAISLGNFMAFMTAFGMLSMSLHDIIDTLMHAGIVAPLWEKITDFSTAETENFISKADPGVLKGQIRVDHLSFSFQLDMPPIIQDLSFEIAPGQCIAFVGMSGCGKSTLIRLLLGFETPQQGSIYFDNRDVKGLNLQILRSQFGLGLQSGAILDGTILDNINSGRYYNEAEVAEAIILAGMESFIQTLPMGMHTVLTNGGLSLSGGERQMILLARALVGNPRVVILDEATSSIDSQRQQEIHQNLSQLPMTRILITQRLDTLRTGVDRIYLMDKGKILSQGTFPELMEKSELFSQLLIRGEDE